MKKLWKQKIVWLSAAALLLVGITAVPEALAYFTTYATASGGVTVNLALTENEMEEVVNGLTKQIQLTNTSSQDEYVRVKVFCGSEFSLSFQRSSEKWSEGEDGYWYYSDIVKPGKMTEALVAEIDVPKDQEEDFDVVVVEESAPVLYREDGSTYADWTMKADKEIMADE